MSLPLYALRVPKCSLLGCVGAKDLLRILLWLGYFSSFQVYKKVILLGTYFSFFFLTVFGVWDLAVKFYRVLWGIQGGKN